MPSVGCSRVWASWWKVVGACPLLLVLLSLPLSWYEVWCKRCLQNVWMTLFRVDLYRPCRLNRCTCMQVCWRSSLREGSSCAIRWSSMLGATTPFLSLPFCLSSAYGRGGELCISHRCPPAPVLPCYSVFVASILAPYILLLSKYTAWLPLLSVVCIC